MRSWENRPDTIVCDEPFYAHYLQQTGLDHPGAEEVIANHATDARQVIADLLVPLPEGKSILYQKHMAHHLLPTIERDWLGQVLHCFLIRDPLDMLTSLVKVLPKPRLSDTGLPQQWQLLLEIKSTISSVPPIIDSRDVLDQPREMLQSLCKALDVPFLEEMLSWPPGPRDTDGVWAKHWYHSVYQSTGFQPYKPKGEPLPEEFGELLAECQQIYDRMHEMRLRP